MIRHGCVFWIFRPTVGSSATSHTSNRWTTTAIPPQRTWWRWAHPHEPGCRLPSWPFVQTRQPNLRAVFSPAAESTRRFSPAIRPPRRSRSVPAWPSEFGFRANCRSERFWSAWVQSNYFALCGKQRMSAGLTPCHSECMSPTPHLGLLTKSSASDQACRRALPHGFEERDDRGHRHVERVGPARHRDAHQQVALLQPELAQAVLLAAHDEGERPAEIRVGAESLGRRGRRHGADAARTQPGSNLRPFRHHHRQREQHAGGGPVSYTHLRA